MTGKALLFRVSRDLARDERGTIAIMAAGTLFMALLVLGLVVDFGFAFNLRNQLQRSADAAALAGASQLGSHTNVRSKANTYSALNMPVALHGDVLANADIKIGSWNNENRVFTTNGAPENAVSVTTRRTSATGNAAPAFFGPLVNIFGYNITTAAIAVNSGAVDDCKKNGFVANGKVYTGSENVFKDGFCVHGEKGVKVGSQNEFHDGVEISMPHFDNEDGEGLDEGSDNNNTPPDGLIDALSERKLIPEDALNADSIMDDIKNGNFANFGAELPDYLSGDIQNISEWPPDNLVDGTLYVVSGVVDFGSDADVQNIGIVGLDEVKVGSNSTVKNALLVSFKTLDLGSNIFVGDNDFCDTHDGEVFLGSKELVKAGSNLDMIGAQIIAGGSVDGAPVDMGSDLTRFTQVGVQSAGDIKIGSQQLLNGCPTSTDEHLLIKKGNIPPRLVN